jgi:hypothetical protein
MLLLPRPLLLLLPTTVNAPPLPVPVLLVTLFCFAPRLAVVVVGGVGGGGGGVVLLCTEGALLPPQLADCACLRFVWLEET